MQNHISTRVTQFAYFDEALDRPVWNGRKILDFGGNIGNFLMGTNGSVDHDDYWCMEVNRAVIEEGRRRFPRAHFVHFDRYSSEFNPDGVRWQALPDCGVKFDFILAFSVFTHTDRSEMLELVNALQGSLAPGGALAFTFCDARYDRSLSDPSLPHGSDVRKNLERVRNRNTDEDIERLVARACDAAWCVVIDEEVYVEPGPEISHQRRSGTPWESYCAYFTVEHLQSLFPGARVVPPVKPAWQHCCVLRSD